jgi:HEAT repeat protein
MEPGDHQSIKSIIPKKHTSYSPVNDRLKKEVGRIIRVVADKRSIPALINLLDDNEYDIRWIAAESLIRIGRSSIIPLLQELRNGRQFQYPGKPCHVLQCLLSRREKKELQHLLSCLSARGDMESVTIEASVVLKKTFGVN